MEMVIWQNLEKKLNADHDFHPIICGRKKNNKKSVLEQVVNIRKTANSRKFMSPEAIGSWVSIG